MNPKRKFFIVFFSVILVSLCLNHILVLANETIQSTNQTGGSSLWWIIGTILFLLLLVGGILGYFFLLQKRFLEACCKNNQIALFAQSPAGLPRGTIRALITLIIVTLSLYIIILFFFDVAGGEEKRFPEVLAAVLSTVIAFYFGTRASSQGQETNQITEATQKQLIKTIDEKDEGQAHEFVNKVDKGINLAKTVIAVLPKDLKEKYQGHVDKLDKGVSIAKSLLSKGDFGGALKEAKEKFDDFVKDNPLKGIITKALESFKSVGISLPSIAVVGSIIGISTKLTGIVYDKWKARILNLPFTPAHLPLKLIDADTGSILFRKSNIMSKVFEKEILEDKRSFIGQATEDFLQKNSDQLWETYEDYFSTLEELELGLSEFRRNVADRELEFDLKDITIEAGNYKQLSKDLDKIYADENSRKDLDLLVEVVEKLQQNQEPVERIFKKVRKEIEK